MYIYIYVNEIARSPSGINCPTVLSVVSPLAI